MKAPKLFSKGSLVIYYQIHFKECGICGRRTKGEIGISWHWFDKHYGYPISRSPKDLEKQKAITDTYNLLQELKYQAGLLYRHPNGIKTTNIINKNTVICGLRCIYRIAEEHASDLTLWMASQE